MNITSTDQDYVQYCITPLGTMEVKANQVALTQVCLLLKRKKNKERPNALTKKAVQQLTEYFNRKRRNFSLPLSFEGTLFQREVWDALAKIPFGQYCSYSQVARNIGRPKACRAVGMANNRNPFMIVIPCHRVIGANQQLVGFGPGIKYQRWLLDFERMA